MSGVEPLAAVFGGELVGSLGERLVLGPSYLRDLERRPPRLRSLRCLRRHLKHAKDELVSAGQPPFSSCSGAARVRARQVGKLELVAHLGARARLGVWVAMRAADSRDRASAAEGTTALMLLR